MSGSNSQAYTPKADADDVQLFLSTIRDENITKWIRNEFREGHFRQGIQYNLPYNLSRVRQK